MAQTALTNRRLIVVTLVALGMASASAFAGPSTVGLTFDGTFQRVTGNVLSMTASDGRDTFIAFPDDAKVTLDGKPCRATDVKPGSKIRVTTSPTDQSVAVGIEALSRNKSFAVERYDGKVVSVTDKNLVMTIDDGPRRTYLLTRDARLTLDGRVCTAAGLKPGTRIRVTTQGADSSVVSRIEGLRKHADFATVVYEGRIVSFADNTLVLAGRQGHGHRTCTPAANVLITRDGQICRPADLKPGMRVRVTSPAEDPAAATRIEALDKAPAFASR
jgi:hypothetical protein